MIENLPRRPRAFSQDEILAMADPQRELSTDELKHGERQKIAWWIWLLVSAAAAVPAVHALANAPK